METIQARSFLKLDDFTAHEINRLLQLASELKRDKRARREKQRLIGRNIVLVFDKTSTRTRCAFEVAGADQGAAVTYLAPSSSQMGVKESIADTAAVLGRMYDAIVYRGFAQSTIETLAAHAGVSVINALTDSFHPTQMLADLMTMLEHSGKPANEIAFAYLGDARFNMGNSLLALGAQMGMDVRIAAPKAYLPEADLIVQCQRMAEESGAKLTFTDDPKAAVEGVDFIHTDIWVSMGEPEEAWRERIEALKPYRVDETIMAASGRDDTRFMHCLPAFHDRNTEISERIYQQYGLNGIEVDNQTFTSQASIVFDQAENRMHTIKALLLTLLDEPKE